MTDLLIAAIREAVRAEMADHVARLESRLDALAAGQAPRLLTIAAAAEAAHVSTCTMRRWEREQVVRSVRRGRRVLIDADSLRPTDAAEVDRLAREAQQP